MSITLDIVARTGSTNADVLARLVAGDSLLEGYWRIADQQDAGRGRQGRSWVGTPGNFMGSTLVHLAAGDPPAHTLTFVAALAVYHAAKTLAGDAPDLLLKWPNDVLLNGEKFCGLLLERQGNSLVCGIGVNLVGMTQVPDRAVAHLELKAGSAGRDDFAAQLANSFSEELALWRQQGAAHMFTRWLRHAHPVGALIAVHDTERQKITGRFAGLAADGALRLKLDNNEVRVIHTGDVALERK